ncbi:hypothetical protein [Kiloniella laminariae]|uniref:hypothetical protein n=1 Tax=Kiloniella laminariae TaxID=454162 RepID=UPI0022B11D0E|nr:hypothetical protein [Kiloniella laminariae]
MQESKVKLSKKDVRMYMYLMLVPLIFASICMGAGYWQPAAGFALLAYPFERRISNWVSGEEP